MDIRQTDRKTDKQTNRHVDSMTDPAQRADSVKIPHTGDTESINVCRQNNQYKNNVWGDKQRGGEGKLFPYFQCVVYVSFTSKLYIKKPILVFNNFLIFSLEDTNKQLIVFYINPPIKTYPSHIFFNQPSFFLCDKVYFQSPNENIKKII